MYDGRLVNMFIYIHTSRSSDSLLAKVKLVEPQILVRDVDLDSCYLIGRLIQQKLNHSFVEPGELSLPTWNLSHPHFPARFSSLATISGDSSNTAAEAAALRQFIANGWIMSGLADCCLIHAFTSVSLIVIPKV